LRIELVKRLLAKIDAVQLSTVAIAVHGQEFSGPKDAKWKRFVQEAWKRSPLRKKYERIIRSMPDEAFEVEYARIDSQPAEIRRILHANIPHLPRRPGGRRASFSIDIRLRAIDDLAHEQRNNSFADAVDLVAARYEMSPDYLRKIWKNRKRIRRF